MSATYISYRHNIETESATSAIVFAAVSSDCLTSPCLVFHVTDRFIYQKNKIIQNMYTHISLESFKCKLKAASKPQHKNEKSNKCSTCVGMTEPMKLEGNCTYVKLQRDTASLPTVAHIAATNRSVQLRLSTHRVACVALHFFLSNFPFFLCSLLHFQLSFYAAELPLHVTMIIDSNRRSGKRAVLSSEI